MLAHTKKPLTDNQEACIIRVCGPARKHREAMEALSRLGFTDASETTPWEFQSGKKKLSVGERLKGARYRENLTQKELAQKTGIPQGHISKIENDKLAVGKDRARRLADVLNIDYRILL